MVDDSTGGEVGWGPDVDVPTLLGDGRERFEAAVSGEATGPVAVVGDPFSGRETVLDRAVRALDATRISLGPGDGVDRIRAGSDGGPVVVENCQHLYERRIGGFKELSAFLDDLASIGSTVVTGWNRYAWAYLTAVQGLDRDFPVIVEVQPLPVERIEELLMGRCDEIPEFVADESEHGGLVVTTRHELNWRGRSISVPVPTVSPVAVRELVSDGDLDPRDVAFGRLTTVSRGNIGVATAIWEARQEPELRPSDISAVGSDRELDREEVFCLRLVLAKERIDRGQLSEVIDGLDRHLGRLARDGLITVTDGTVELVPAAVPVAAEAAERRRML
jgi:hypothetical protein